MSNLTSKQIIQKLNDAVQGKRGFIYRGEAMHFSSVSCTLYRALGDIYDEHGESFSLVKAERDVVEKAKRLFSTNASALEIITELQHYGGKTTLIDFSYNIFIALFFACNGSFEKDGRILFLDAKNLIQQNDLYSLMYEQGTTLLKPYCGGNRVIFQNSVFVHEPTGVIGSDKFDHIITIPASHKRELLDYLSHGLGIHEGTVYNDLLGFVQNENNFESAHTHYYRGRSKWKVEDHLGAIVDPS